MEYAHRGKGTLQQVGQHRKVNPREESADVVWGRIEGKGHSGYNLAPTSIFPPVEVGSVKSRVLTIPL